MKILTEEDIRWKGVDHYLKLKDYFNKGVVSDLYQKIYRHPNSIGYVSELIKNINPKDYEEAYEKYLLSGVNDCAFKPKINRGRSAGELEDLAIEWKEKSGSKRPLQDFYDALVLHAVVETFDGNKTELSAANAYRKRGYTVTIPSGQDDRTCGIDFIAEKDGKKVVVQVKPVSFFRGGERNKGLVHDRVVFFAKKLLAAKRYEGATFAVMIHTDDNRWLNVDGRLNFLYEELVSEDGKVIVDIDEMESKAIEI